MDNILKPQEETLELLAAELGFVIPERDPQTKSEKEKGDDRKFRQPAMQKPFSQLT